MRASVTKSQGEGADASYDGANKSDFAVNVAKPSSNFATAKPRFSDNGNAAPEVEVATRGIADIAVSKPSSNFAAAKPRFGDAPPAGPDYQAPESDFDKAARNAKPSFTGDKPRGAWMDSPANENPAAYYEAPGAFNVTAKASSNFAAAKPRFGEPQASAPDVDIRTPGIGDVHAAKPSSNFAAAKPRFEDPAPAGPDYQFAESDFDKAARNAKPSFTTPEKDKPRGAWMDSPANENPASYYEAPGAFNVTAKASANFSAAQPRFQDPTPVSPAGYETTQSDFTKAVANAKPSAHMAAADKRFKNDTPSYGDPGSLQTGADIERMKMLQKPGGGFHS